MTEDERQEIVNLIDSVIDAHDGRGWLCTNIMTAIEPLIKELERKAFVSGYEDCERNG